MKVSELQHELTTNSAGFGRSKDVQVVFEGTEAGTDGSTIMLPALPDTELNTQQERILRGYVDHEAGHLRHSNVPFVIDKYKKWNEAGHQGLKNIHNALEDVWMERKVCSEYRGSRKNLKELTESVQEKELKALKEYGQELATNSSTTAAFSITSTGLDYGTKHQEEVKGFIPEDMRPHTEQWIKALDNCKNSEDVIEVAKKVYQHLIDDPESQSDPEDFPDQEGYSGEEKEEGEEEPKEGQVDEDGDPTEAGGKPSGDEGEGEGQKKLEEQLAEANPSDTLSEEFGNQFSPSESGEYTGPYKKWTTKYDAISSRKNLKGVNKSVFTKTDITPYNKAVASIGPGINVMKNRLARSLISKQKRDWDTGRLHGKLDSKRLVSGYLGSNSVYKQRQESNELDTAVTLLMDLSGSMVGSRVRTASQCAIAMAICLEKSGIPFSILGFTNNYHSEETPDDYYNLLREVRGSKQQFSNYDPVNHVIFKDFNDSLRSSRPYLGQAYYGGLDMQANVDPEAILWGGYHLLSRQEKRKVYFVFSDGQPAFTGDCKQNVIDRYTKEAVQTISKKGIEVIGVGIESNAVTKYYDDSFVVNNINEFTGQVFTKLTRKLLGNT